LKTAAKTTATTATSRARRAAPVGAATALFAAVTAVACTTEGRPGAGHGGGEEEPIVNVYSHRHYDTDRQLFERFTAETGIAVNVVTASADELITRLESEGANSPADVLITVDAGRLHRAKERGLLRPIDSAVLRENVPVELRDPDGHWYGLTKRARVLVYAKDRVRPEELSTYEALADARWRGRVLTRSSENVYNQSLLASLIAASGEDAALAWARGIARNLARPPSGGDTDQVKAVAAGAGDVAIVNTYYVARLMESPDADERRVGDAVGVFFPNQMDRGTHVNVSGAGVTASSRRPGNARRLIEFLSGEAAQRLLAEGNYEYPVKPGVEAAAVLRGWGAFREDALSLETLGRLNGRAVMLFDRAGWR
jgi:iron(III) transport system substrate-binding protein